MKDNEEILQTIERALKKVAEKLEPLRGGREPLSDLLIQVKPESGELRIYNDSDEELTRCVVPQWIESKDEQFYEHVQPMLLQAIHHQKELLENLPLLKPYSFVLIGEDRETMTDLYLVDDETIMLDCHLLKGLDEELETFLAELLKK